MHFRYNNFHTTALARLFASAPPRPSTPFVVLFAQLVMLFLFQFSIATLCCELLQISFPFQLAPHRTLGFRRTRNRRLWAPRITGSLLLSQCFDSPVTRVGGSGAGACPLRDRCSRDAVLAKMTLREISKATPELYQASSDLYFRDIFKIQFNLEFVLYLTLQNFRQYCYLICKVIKLG